MKFHHCWLPWKMSFRRPCGLLLIVAKWVKLFVTSVCCRNVTFLDEKSKYFARSGWHTQFKQMACKLPHGMHNDALTGKNTHILCYTHCIYCRVRKRLNTCEEVARTKPRGVFRFWTTAKHGYAADRTECGQECTRRRVSAYNLASEKKRLLLWSVNDVVVK